MGISNAQLNKKKLCLHYRVYTSYRIKRTLEVYNNVTELECMRRCAFNRRCMSYNLVGSSSVCELMPAMGRCDESEEREDSTFVHLRTCSGRVPRNLNRRDWQADAPCLTWTRVDVSSPTAACPPEITRSPNDGVCAALVPTKGMYLPGWYETGRVFRTVTEQAQPVSCKKQGYLLTVASECPTNWTAYTTGNPIPTNAVKISRWIDDTPGYMVTAKFIKWTIGYYLPSIERTFLIGTGTQSPTIVSMLVYL